MLAVNLSANHRCFQGLHSYKTCHIMLTLYDYYLTVKQEVKEDRGGAYLRGHHRMYTDVNGITSKCFYRTPAADSSCFCGDQKQILFTWSQTISISERSNQNKYFRRNHDVSVALTEWFLSLSLTREQTQRCDEREEQKYSTKTNGKLQQTETVCRNLLS